MAEALRVFVASSSEQLKTARTVAKALTDKDLIANPWTEGTFTLAAGCGSIVCTAVSSLTCGRHRCCGVVPGSCRYQSPYAAESGGLNFRKSRSLVSNERVPGSGRHRWRLTARAACSRLE
jgi:hypothetical protein